MACSSHVLAHVAPLLPCHAEGALHQPGIDGGGTRASPARDEPWRCGGGEPWSVRVSLVHMHVLSLRRRAASTSAIETGYAASAPQLMAFARACCDRRKHHGFVVSLSHGLLESRSASAKILDRNSYRAGTLRTNRRRITAGLWQRSLAARRPRQRAQGNVWQHEHEAAAWEPVRVWRPACALRRRHAPLHCLGGGVDGGGEGGAQLTDATEAVPAPLARRSPR